MTVRTAILIGALPLAACRQATPAEVGAHDQAGAFPHATMMAVEHGAARSPEAVSPVAKGTPMAQPPAR